MEGGLPGAIDSFSVTELNDLKIYIPNNMSFADDVVRIVDFKKRNGMNSVGVSNVRRNN